MAASLSSVEAEELGPAAVFEDEAGCMGLILIIRCAGLNGLCYLVDRLSGAKFWRVAGMADCLVRVTRGC